MYISAVFLRNWTVPNRHLAKAAATRAVNVSPIPGLEWVHKPGHVVAMPEAIADFAVLAQVFITECALDILEVLNRLVALMLSGVSLCSGCIAFLHGSLQSVLELSDTIFEAVVVSDQAVHHTGVLFGSAISKSYRVVLHRGHVSAVFAVCTQG
ncbi:hypothetical protein N9K47_00320 [bacterium]|nr:hypothetical protein [bacterium]